MLPLLQKADICRRVAEIDCAETSGLSGEEVTKSGDAAVASEGGYLPPSCGDRLCRNIWTLWRHDRPKKFDENLLKGMKS
ncbi:hypothetical protein T11_13675 [Trichinella zimbabwensis]|uniref:Uncharacterized protein n=1 Tax=Trichinella zimbabwensis TaxID=268475 RepID=A0A0V1H1V3_9BILA|nr:hypothetical protein T11_13675 [Trichinella zimbabwensis]